MKANSKIYVAGHSGLLGSAIVRKLSSAGHTNLLLISHRHLDLTDQKAVDGFFKKEKPEYVIIAAGKVGGVMANDTQRGDFIYINTMINFNIIHAAWINNCTKLMAVGSSCIYPRFSPQPIKEEYLLTGELEPTNEPYAISKIAGLKLCDAYRQQYECNFISAMPTNLYGQGDTYDSFSSHVLPALIKKIHAAKVNGDPTVTVWGTGTVRREFMYVDDAADGIVFLMNNYNEAGHVNIGTGIDLTIKELAETICKVIDYQGELVFDTSKPDGMKEKRLDVSKIHNLGWWAKYNLLDGLIKTYKDYVNIR